MIYSESFIEYLKFKLGEPINIKPNNIVCRCPWCEIGTNKKHYHLWISLELPIFHCFNKECGESGNIKKLFRALEGTDKSKEFVDEKAIKRSSAKTARTSRIRNIYIPKINNSQFRLKDLYVRKRLRFTPDTNFRIAGLVYDIGQFVEKNNIELTDSQRRLLPYLHSNFVGFVLFRRSKMVLRNIDEKSDFRFYNLILSKNLNYFIDYFLVTGNNKLGKDLVLAEGIFDILSSKLFWKPDFDPRLFAAGMSSVSYESLIKSLCLDNSLFSCNIHILSDLDIKPYFYKRLKNKLSHLVENMTIYYNKGGKDFNDLPLSVERLTI